MKNVSRLLAQTPLSMKWSTIFQRHPGLWTSLRGRKNTRGRSAHPVNDGETRETGVIHTSTCPFGSAHFISPFYRMGDG